MTEDEKKCPLCAEMVKSEARICRHCRHKFFFPQKVKPPRPQNTKLIVLGILTVTMGFALKTQIYAVAQRLLDNFRPAPIHVTLGNLEKEFDIRGMEAQARYSGKSVVLNATVAGSDIERLKLKTIFLMPVTAKLIEHQLLAEGRQVTLHCRSVTAQGAIIGYKPLLQDCDLLH